MSETLWVVSSSMDYGECATVNGVFSSEELAAAWIAENADKDFGYYTDKFIVDIPGIQYDD